MSAWRPALRIAWRDALRARGRTTLMLAMIALPVLAVSAAMVVQQTAEVAGSERVDRIMGAADARAFSDGQGRAFQLPDPEEWKYGYLGGGASQGAPTTEQVIDVLGDGMRALPIRTGWVRAEVGDRAVHVPGTELDLRDPMTVGMFDLTSGRLPEARGEVVVNEAFLTRGAGLGDSVPVAGREVTVVGAGIDARYRDQEVIYGLPGSGVAGEEEARPEWLLEGGDVTWDEVRQLNDIGVVVTSRAVLADPPPVVEQAEAMGFDTGSDEIFAVIAVLVTMVLLEVVLLAGPAFAVSARRQSRTLALVAASGGTPRQARAVVMATGVVIGTLAAVAGVVLGVLLGWALLPLVQRFQGNEWFGPFDVPVTWLWGVAAFGLVAALLAAVVPAFIAARQDVVAVLAGRRGDRKPSVRTPLLGLVLLGAGIAAASWGALASARAVSGAYWIAGAAIISVLGMIMCVPVVVATVARMARWLPLSLRFAGRDAARHRTRTVPAVAAVAATVAGVVALGISVSSDELKNRESYELSAPMGVGAVTWFPEDDAQTPGDAAEVEEAEAAWRRVEEIVRSAAPDAGMQPVHGVGVDKDGNGSNLSFLEPGVAEGWPMLEVRSLGESVLVADRVPAHIVTDHRAELDRALAAGKVVVWSGRKISTPDVVLERMTHTVDGWEEAPPRRLPAHYVVVDAAAPAAVIVPTAVVDDLGLGLRTTSLVLTGGIDKTEQKAIDEQVTTVAEGMSVYVERGYERSSESLVLLGVLGVLGGVLMLGGTLTATFLALSDARADLATLSAVGASPHMRRRVAASYALVVGVVGAVLGAAVGMIPGIAVSRPLTMLGGAYGGPTGPFLDIPWLLIGALVVLLPLLTAAVVGLTARSRLPLVARLD